MKDKDFDILLEKTAIAYNEFYRLCKEAEEEEYKRRYGYYPCEMDDDYWIDSFGGNGVASFITSKQVDEHSKGLKPTNL